MEDKTAKILNKYSQKQVAINKEITKQKIETVNKKLHSLNLRKLSLILLIGIIGWITQVALIRLGWSELLIGLIPIISLAIGFWFNDRINLETKSKLENEKELYQMDMFILDETTYMNNAVTELITNMSKMKILGDKIIEGKYTNQEKISHVHNNEQTNFLDMAYREMRRSERLLNMMNKRLEKAVQLNHADVQTYREDSNHIELLLRPLIRSFEQAELSTHNERETREKYLKLLQEDKLKNEDTV